MLTAKDKMLLADEPYTCLHVLQMHSASLHADMAYTTQAGDMETLDGQLELMRHLSVVIAYIKDEHAI